MENSVLEPTGPTNFNKFAVPVKMGLLIGIVGCLLTAINFMFLVSHYMVFLVFNFVIFLVTVVFYWVTAVQQRKALGGFIDLRQAFQAVFIAILISGIITTVFGVVYTKMIDPGVVERIKEGTLSFMERMNVPDEKLDQTAADIDQQVIDSTKPGRLFYAFAKSLIISSIFGFICALIARRQRPVL